MLDRIFSKCPIAVSIKTRIGYHGEEEFIRLLEIYNQYPVRELTVHPRTRKEMYAGAVHKGALDYALAHSRAPVCVNGDLFTPELCRQAEVRYPEASGLMLGRGAASDPALFRRLRGGAAADRAELRLFHERLYADYRELLGTQNAMRKMKELWHFLLGLFEDNGELRKKIARTKDVGKFEDAVAAVFAELPLCQSTGIAEGAEQGKENNP